MVLAELGGKLRESLRKFHGGSGGSALTKQHLSALLNDIARALMEADVNVKLVMNLRNKIQTKVEHLLQDEQQTGDGEDEAKNRAAAERLSKTVQRAVVDELVTLLSPGSTASDTTTTTTSSSKGKKKKGGDSSNNNAARARV